MSHVSFLVEEDCCVTCLISSRRRMLCHMFRFWSKKNIVSHVASLVEEECCVTCFVFNRRRMLCHMFRLSFLFLFLILLFVVLFFCLGFWFLFFFSLNSSAERVSYMLSRLARERPSSSSRRELVDPSSSSSTQARRPKLVDLSASTSS